jgi:UDP-N-acetylmuramoylalanine--D-glutamate ligase
MATQRKSIYQVIDKFGSSGDMAATLNNKLINLRSESLAESLNDFENSTHKLEYVKSIDGIDFINDSRSTNVNSVWFALESMSKPTIWIMSINSVDLISEELIDLVNEKVKTIIIQGVYNSAIYDFFKGLKKEVIFSMNLEEATRSAFYSGQSGDVVLFSPGVVSGGMFKTYRERGDMFKDAVSQL